MNEVTPSVQKWLKKRVKVHFNNTIDQKLQEKIHPDVILDEITQSKDLKDLIKSTKLALKGQQDFIDCQATKEVEFDLKSYLSFASDLSNDNWTSLKPNVDILEVALDNLSPDKPIHVRLAGFEALNESEVTNNCSPESFEALLKSLREGISDDSHPIFEASLRVHSKLLETPRSHDVYTNLLNSFDNEYNTKKLHETLPNFNTGINFKIYLHEKLFRIINLIVRHQKEILKSLRGIDRTVEEMIDQFVVFLNSPIATNSLTKPLTILNLVSIIDPQANWSKKWFHSMATRKNLINAISKTPSLLQNVLDAIKKGFDDIPSTIAYSVSDEPALVFISGETIDTITYIHCLNFLSQLCCCSLGRNLLGECPLVTPPSPIDFLIALVNSLNNLALSTAPRVVYNQSRQALNIMLDQPTMPCDTRLYHVGLSPLMKPLKTGTKIWLHTIDILNFMINTKDGLNFLIDELRRESANNQDKKSKYPCMEILIYISDLLRQPIAVMNVELLVEIFKFIGLFFENLEDIQIIELTLKKNFLPSIEYFYSKINKYAIGNENRTQHLDSAAKNMLIKIVSSPAALKLLTNYPIVFEEIIRSSINPLKHSWSSNETVAFICSATYFDLGRQVIGDLISQTFSMLLTDVCANLEDPLIFFDPWDTENTKKFIHVVSLLSINTECFEVLLLDTEEDNCDEFDHPRSFCDLLKCSMIDDSPYHGFSLLILETIIWNLDILVHILNIYDLHTQLLELQEDCLMEVIKYKEKPEDEEEIKDYDKQNSEVEDEEIHTIYRIDESSFFRHKILSNSFFIKHKLAYPKENPEKSILFSSFPPYDEDNYETLYKTESTSELDELLQECKPGLRDSGWIMQVKKCHQESRQSMKHSTLMNLLDQMEKAIPTVDWVDVFKWENPVSTSYQWLTEDDFALELAIRYAEDNCEKLENELKAKENLKKLFEDVHTFIKYEKTGKYEGFDWFLATIFIICNGNIDKSKIFVKQIVRFPSAMFMWSVLGRTADRNNGEERATDLIIAQHIESVVNQELPAANHTLKNEFGIKWWMICNRLLTQCYWSVLKWPEIIHFFAICILNPPDYIVYYCVALLEHCQEIMKQDIIDKKSWPEEMNFSEFQCHNYMGFMEKLAKRHRNEILPSLTQRKFILIDE